jgi:hypothetical protein
LLLFVHCRRNTFLRLRLSTCLCCFSSSEATELLSGCLWERGCQLCK